MVEGIHLSLLMGPFVALPAPRNVVESLTGVQITSSSTGSSGFQLTFSVAKESAINTTLIPAGYFDPKIRVVLVVTVNGLPNVLMDGIVTRQELSASNEPGKTTLTVTGEDVSLLMGLDHRRIPMPALPDYAKINLALLPYLLNGVVPLVIPPIIDAIDSPTERWFTQNSTDLAFIQQMAEESGYVFYIDPGPLPNQSFAYFGPEIRIGIPQPALNVGMDGESNVESLSFTYDGMAREQPTIVVLDPITHKVPIPIPIPDVSILKPPLAIKPATAFRTRPLSNVAKMSAARALLVGIAHSANSADAITASGQLDVLRYGRVLKSRGLVGVRGAGLAYDGLYFVKSVTHTIKRGEYKQSFTLVRDGLISITPKVVP
ncbi:MAG TPA: hypothetical protein VF520_12830 [Thermoleophilaceae bacterium]|jgi:hypothetical protein